MSGSRDHSAHAAIPPINSSAHQRKRLARLRVLEERVRIFTQHSLTFPQQPALKFANRSRLTLVYRRSRRSSCRNLIKTPLILYFVHVFLQSMRLSKGSASYQDNHFYVRTVDQSSPHLQRLLILRTPCNAQINVLPSNQG